MSTAFFKKLVLVTVATGAVAGTGHAATEKQSLDVGRIEISTVPFDPGLSVRSATYTPSGKILVSYAKEGNTDPRLLTLAVMDDDGTNVRTFFSKHIPDLGKDNGIREMIFPDNQRIFLGDFILECAPSIDRCDKSSLVPVQYPKEVADGDHISHRWSEMIVAPDNRHIAWTTLLSNYSAVVLTGALRKEDQGYVIAQPQIISTLDPFQKDPRHADGVIPGPLRGGEVKQFVHGGTAISLVGAVKHDIPDSVVQHLASGEMEAITDTPGYTETTIFSPDERLGMTMTTRFSENTDPAVLGLMPRPYPVSLNMGLSMFAYTYSVTGVRGSRPGNIGPALINIEASKTQDGYLGTNLSTEKEWVYRSPMSWHPSSTKALWIEGNENTGARRIQRVALLDYKPGTTVAAKPTPSKMSYASSDLSVIPDYANNVDDMDVRVYGKASGHIEYRRSPSSIRKVYVNFSDDGKSTYTGHESLLLNPRGNSTYEADIRLSGPQPGVMDLKVTFGPISGNPPTQIIFSPGPDGKPLSSGYTEYAGKRLEVESLEP